MSQTDDYWKEQKEHSRVKSEIVSAYLIPWANIIGQHCHDLYYLDLFSGRGRYECGSPSTPIMIMDELSKRPDLASRIRLSFYEGRRDWLEKLEAEILSHPACGLLPDKPFFKHQVINTEFAKTLSNCITKGTYSLIDPWGYSEISLDLLDVATKAWGCDCMFYLSTSGLIRNLGQQDKWPNIEKFFGRESFLSLMKTVENMGENDDLSSAIFTTIKESLKMKRGYMFLRYLVEFDASKRPSHYLVFLTKHWRGFKIMRDIMLKRGLADQHGIPSMVFSPVRTREANQFTLEMVTPGDNLGKLCADVMSDFSGKTVIVSELLDQCLHNSYPYREAHVRNALVELRKQGKLDVVDAPTKQARSKIGNKAIIRIT